MQETKLLNTKSKKYKQLRRTKATKQVQLEFKSQVLHGRCGAACRKPLQTELSRTQWQRTQK